MLERIIAAVVDTKLLTLYREDGSTIEIPQTDPRVRGIITQVMPIIQQGGVAEIDLSHLSNTYKEYEEKSSGLIRIFRVAKKAIANIFGTKEIDTVLAEGGTFGTVPPVAPVPMMAAVDEILATAESVSHADYKEGDTTENHTMIAVVADDTGNQKIIPGIEVLKEQFAYYTKLGSSIGMDAFFKRLANVIDKRPHSVEDLLRFLEKGDLPIADDGQIIAYKRLYAENEKHQPTGRYVDPHTRKVSQTVGSYVCVDESMVDLNRRNECSNGLHIGRRGYMGGFSGDVMFMCKIDPADVMVVPHNDPNKIRVKGYHILAKLNNKAFQHICANRPATSDPETAKLLTNVIQGKHTHRTEIVRIRAPQGGDVSITKLDANGKTVKNTPEPEKNALKHVALDDDSISKVDPKEIAKAVSVAKKKTVAAAPTNADTARIMFAEGMYQDLIAFKKAKKKSWLMLGFTEAEVEAILRSPDQKGNQKAEAEVAPKPEAEPKAKLPKAEVTAKAVDTVMASVSPSKGTVQGNARELFVSEDWTGLALFRRLKKKSWEALGFTSDEINKIKKSIGS